MAQQLSDLRFDILRNAIYHSARTHFFDRIMRVLNLCIIVLGASAATELFPPEWQKWLAGGAAIAAALQLVGDFAGLTRLHGYLQRRCYELLAELEATPAPDESKVASVRSKLTALYGEEPPPMRALDAIAYNAACDSVGKSRARVEIGVLETLLSNIWPYNGTEFVPKSRDA
jgi:hypothetical protein